MIKHYICCLVLFIGIFMVGLNTDIKFLHIHQEIVTYDNFLIIIGRSLQYGTQFFCFCICFQWQIQDFPLVGALSHWGGTNLQHRCFSAKMYVKTKELDPVGERAGSNPLDPPMVSTKMCPHWRLVPPMGQHPPQWEFLNLD